MIKKNNINDTQLPNSYARCIDYISNIIEVNIQIAYLISAFCAYIQNE
jgi:hypothetical protein